MQNSCVVIILLLLSILVADIASGVLYHCVIDPHHTSTDINLKLIKVILLAWALELILEELTMVA
jgi:hypothetical protein